jgi:hypothetical protein
VPGFEVRFCVPPTASAEGASMDGWMSASVSLRRLSSADASWVHPRCTADEPDAELDRAAGRWMYAGHPGPLILGARTVSGPQARQQWDATRSCDQQCSPTSRALMRARSGPQRAVNCPGRRRSSRQADTSSSSSSSPAHARQNMGRCAPVFRGRHARRRRDRPAFWAELRVLRDCAHGHHFAGRLDCIS